MGGLQPWHWAVIIIAAVVLFGAKRLPDAARSIGRSVRILKAETRGLHDDDVQAKSEAQQTSRQPLDGQVVNPPAAEGRPSDQPRDSI